MEAKAYLRYVRISPRKVQIVCDLIRGKDINTAMALLMQTPKAASASSKTGTPAGMPETRRSAT